MVDPLENGISTEGTNDNDGDGSVQVELVPSRHGVYANYVGMLRTQHDLTFDFFVTEFTGPTSAEPRHVGRYVVPLTLLKGLHEALGEQIAGYERDFGFELPNYRARETGEATE